MAESNRDRINPSLLDRLTDEGPGAPGRGASTTVSELRRSVLRDLTWLFNTTRPFAPEAQHVLWTQSTVSKLPLSNVVHVLPPSVE
jgi:predicted component of type VI protein secretion system